MRLINEKEVALSYPYIIFKKSFIANFNSQITFILIAVVLYELYSRNYIPYYIFIIPEIFLFLIFCLSFVMLGKTVGRTNWLIKADFEKIFINIRSCLNSNLPPESKIIELELKEIKQVCLTYIDVWKYLDIYVDLIPEEIRNAVINEKIEPNPKHRTRCDDYPVSLKNEHILRINYAQITPSIWKALKFLEQQGILIENPKYEPEDYPSPLLDKQ
jgi:hypothetical protein